MALRTINFQVLENGIQPGTPQDAGVAGDHHAVAVAFDLSLVPEYVRENWLYRFEFVDGMDQYDTAETATIAQGQTVFQMDIPREWTETGGVGSLRLVISRIDDSGEVMTMHTFAGLLRFAGRETGEREKTYRTGLSELIADTRAAATAAEEAAAAVGDAVDTAHTAAASANAAASSANTAADRANAAADGITNTYAPAIPASASGAVAALTDVAATGTLTRAAILGATAQAGTPSPAAPVPVTGVTPTKLMTTGKNLFNAYSVPSTSKITVNAPDIIITKSNDWYINVDYPLTDRALLPGVTYTLSMTVKSLSGMASTSFNCQLLSGGTQVAVVISGFGAAGATISVPLTYAAGPFDTLRIGYGRSLATETGSVVVTGIQLEAGTAATAYEAYRGQTVALPALAALYGENGALDVYDAVSGAEARAWNRIAFNGTETWIREGAQTSGKYLFRVTGIPLPMKPSSNDTPGQVRSSHYVTDTANNQWRTNESVAISVYGYLYIYDSSHNTTVDDFKAWLAAQAAAGTPVTVVYRLATPTTTQNGGTAIAPPHPSAFVYADAGIVDVGYGKDTKAYIARAIAAAIARA